MDLLKEATDVKDLVVVDPILSFKGEDTAALISADGTNPSREGERALASALAKALANSGIPPATLTSKASISSTSSVACSCRPAGWWR